MGEMIQIANLIKKFRNPHGEPIFANNGIHFSVSYGDFFTLLGPSGCGKTTLLRIIAGLEHPDAGEIRIGEKLVCSVEKKVFIPPNERNIGMVFQSYAIWPHMTVFENVAFPLTVGKKYYKKKDIVERVNKILTTVQLDGYQNRPATNMSGGQQQRLALARALVHEPKVLLLDEPLSNLDAKLREQLRFELRQLQRQLGITTIYVTHDQSEALAMSNLIAIMYSGRIVQQGTPREIFEQPANQFTADFIGSTNFFSGVIEGSLDENGDRCVKTNHGRLRCHVPMDIQNGEAVLVSIRPRNIQLADKAKDEFHNIFSGRIHETAFLGDYVDCQLEVGDQMIRFFSEPRLQFLPGDSVNIHLPEEHCLVIAEKNTLPA